MSIPSNITSRPLPYELYIELDVLNETITATSEFTSCTLLSNAFVSLGLSLQLISDTQNDRRKYLNKNYKLERLAENLILQFNLISDLLPHIDSETTQKKLTKNFPNNLHELSNLPGNLFEKTNRQITPMLRSIISKYNFSKLFLKLNQVNSLHNQETEDFFFCVTHQITECWLNIYAKLADDFSESLATENYPFSFNIGCLMVETLEFVTQHIQLLDLMIIRDYHPLRVKLRDASGAQSKQAHYAGKFIISSFETFHETLKIKNISLVDIIYTPKNLADLYQVVITFQKLAKSYQAFLFKHYTLAGNILGQNTFGSLGYELNGLVGHVVKPLLPRVDQALYDIVNITNFQYSEYSGILVKEKEESIFKNLYEQKIETLELDEHILEEKTDLHFSAFQNKDQNLWLELFDKQDCVFQDHLTSKPYFGLTKIKNYITTLWSATKTLEYIITKKSFLKNIALYSWNATITMYNDKTISFSGTEKLFFNSEYKIVRIEANWNPEEITHQLYGSEFQEELPEVVSG